MKLNTLQVVVVTFACLLFSAPSHAQLGGLGAYAKSKIARQAERQGEKLNNKVDEETDKATDKEISKMTSKGNFGEAQATFAHGVKPGKSVQVARVASGTPDHSAKATKQAAAAAAAMMTATASAISNGSSQVVTLKVTHGDARQLDTVRGFKPCNKISDFQILSATQMKATIDLTGNKSAGMCALSFVSGGNTAFSTNVTVQAKK